MHQNFELVSQDYYNEELRYQDKIDGANNANKLTSIEIKQTANEVSIQLPKEVQRLGLTGQTLFYCTANSANDRSLPLKVNDEGLMLIDKSKLAKANYKVKLNWQIGNDQYYTEQNLSIN